MKRNSIDVIYDRRYCSGSASKLRSLDGAAGCRNGNFELRYPFFEERDMTWTRQEET